MAKKRGKMEKIYEYISKCLVWCIGGVWGYLEPTIPFALICFFAICLDVYSAWRLAKRIRKNHPEIPEDKVHDKFESEKAKKIFPTMLMISSVVVLFFLMDKYIFTMTELYLANWAAGGFCLVQAWSVLENESSENGATWAKALQKIMVNKAARHVEDAQEIIDILKKYKDGED